MAIDMASWAFRYVRRFFLDMGWFIGQALSNLFPVRQHVQRDKPDWIGEVACAAIGGIVFGALIGIGLVVI